MADVQLSGPDRVRLVLALSRAQVVPFTDSDWSCWAGAEGEACMVYLHRHDDDYFRKVLGIEHWPRDSTVVILDNGGLTWNGMGVLSAYAWHVNVCFNVGYQDVGTPEEMWEDGGRMRPDDRVLEQAIAKLPEAARQMVMACPEEARDYVVRGYLQSAEAKASISVERRTAAGQLTDDTYALAAGDTDFGGESL